MSALEGERKSHFGDMNEKSCNDFGETHPVMDTYFPLSMMLKAFICIVSIYRNFVAVLIHRFVCVCVCVCVCVRVCVCRGRYITSLRWKNDCTYVSKAVFVCC